MPSRDWAEPGEEDDSANGEKTWEQEATMSSGKGCAGHGAEGYPKSREPRHQLHLGETWGAAKGDSHLNVLQQQRELSRNPVTGSAENARARTWGWRLEVRGSRAGKIVWGQHVKALFLC